MSKDIPNHRASIEAAISAFAESGIDFRAPWQCDLDDLEMERFDALHRALSAAVLAERERCAKIAEKEGVYPELNTSAEWYRHAQRIAAAIRNQRQENEGE